MSYLYDSINFGKHGASTSSKYLGASFLVNLIETYDHGHFVTLTV